MGLKINMLNKKEKTGIEEKDSETAKKLFELALKYHEEEQKRAELLRGLKLASNIQKFAELVNREEPK